jgi:hypothetical protein
MGVPNTNTFSLQDVVNEINPGSNSLQGCVNDAVTSNFDSNYFTSPATSLLEFRNYQVSSTSLAVLYIAYPLEVGVGKFSNVNNSSIGSPNQDFYEGERDSNLIVNQSGHIISAAKSCLDLVANGYSDWYLAGPEVWPSPLALPAIQAGLLAFGDPLLDEKLATSKEAPFEPGDFLSVNPLSPLTSPPTSKGVVTKVRAVRAQGVPDLAGYNEGDFAFGGIILRGILTLPGNVVTSYTLSYGLDQNTACSVFADTTIWQDNSPFSFNEDIYFNEALTIPAISGWYASPITGEVREWSGTSWLGLGQTTCLLL